MSGNLLMRKFKGISIAGCHGKTTTTAMIATILVCAKESPSYVIGTSSIPSLGAGGHLGQGIYFIAEADEYANDPKFDRKPKFLWQHPSILVITNIDFDHPDIYENIEEVKDAYAKFVGNLDNGLLIINGDDINSKKIIESRSNNITTFGENIRNDYYFNNVIIDAERTYFTVFKGNKSLGKFFTHLSGVHSVYNALAAIVVSLSIGLDIKTISRGLDKFTGTKRRLDFLGNLTTGASVFDDYGHHPTEIMKTLEGVHLRYPNKKIVCIFQPHTFSRTKKLFDKFIYSFSYADIVIVSSIYGSKRESSDSEVTGEKLAEAIIKKKEQQVIFLPNLSDVVKYLRTQGFGENTLLISMGAGDIYTIWNDLL